jgi:hypothetical protein
MSRLKIFVSSVQKELETERKPMRAFEAVGGKVGGESSHSPEADQDQVGTKLGLSRDQVAILRYLKEPQSIASLLKIAGRSNRTKFRDQVLSPMIDNNLIEMTIPEKPTSSQQKYRLTAKGKVVLRTPLRTPKPENESAWPPE